VLKIPAFAKRQTVSGNAMTTLKLIQRVVILTFLIDCSCSSKADKGQSADTSQATSIVQKVDTSLNGLYAGLEYIGTSTDPAYPGKVFKAYHLGYLKIKGDSVFLDQNPIFVHEKDTSYSAFDGGFYYYSGTLTKTDTTVLLNLKELFCDYCGVSVEMKPDGTQQAVKRTKQLKGRLTDKGFLIDGYLYARTTKKEELMSEHPEPYLKLQ
jgi:hypothetical protein